jgi:hypothetical protein
VNSDLSARIAADISDYCDLIVRKAGEQQRGGRESNKPRPVNK